MPSPSPHRLLLASLLSLGLVGGLAALPLPADGQVGARAYAPVRYQSLDIALTPDGPCIIEINSGGSFMLAQIASGRGFLTPSVRAFFQGVADRLWLDATGSASRVARLHVLAEPPAIDAGEVTDKGSINQRAVLSHRASLVEALYEGREADPFLILPNKV